MRCAGFSGRGRGLAGSRHSGSAAAAPGLLSADPVAVAHGLIARCMWDLPEPGIAPLSPALAGGFLSTVPQGGPVKFHSDCSVSHPQYRAVDLGDLPMGVVLTTS